MISNPGFSFKNINGTYYIDSINNTDMDNIDPLYSKAIICKEYKGLVEVYSDRVGLTKDSESVAFKFAKIDINNNDEILKFCEQYGLPMSERNFANFRNDYLFFEIDKDEFIKRIPLDHKERERLTGIKKNIVAMRLLLELSEAIHLNDHDAIIRIITFFCFDLSVFDYEGSRHKTELFQFNHAFYHHAEARGYKKFRYEHFDFTGCISSLLNNIIEDVKTEEFLHSYHMPYRRRYIQYDYTEWRHLRALFEDILKQTDIIRITPFGDVVFSKPLSDINYFIQLNESNLLNLAKAVLSDLFKEKLHTVSPEIQFYGGDQIAGWRIPTLIDAMYLELFFRFTPAGKVRKCADPFCRGFFMWSPTHPTKKYCDNVCAMRAAKRNQRQRDKRKADSKK